MTPFLYAAVLLAATGIQVQTAEGEEVALSLVLSTDEASWDRAGAESVVAHLLVDGERSQDIVVTGAARPYKVLVGPLSAGVHEIRIEPETVRVEEAVAHAGGDPALLHGPILVGRPDAARSDTPLLLFVEERRDGERLVLEYSVIFSSEDGGTGTLPPLLPARYGRTTDIEWVCRVALEGDRVVEEEFQGEGHRSRPFRGDHVGAHPILRVGTTYNTVAEDAGDGLRFALAPIPWDGEGPRERIQDANPWIYRIANEEMAREALGGRPKMETPGDAATATLSDARNYVYVEARVEAGTWRFGARVGGAWLWSDHGMESARVGGGGWIRTAIELPEGASPQEIAAEGPGEVASLRAFRLGDDFGPRPDERLTWNVQRGTWDVER